MSIVSIRIRIDKLNMSYDRYHCVPADFSVTGAARPRADVDLVSEELNGLEALGVVRSYRR